MRLRQFITPMRHWPSEIPFHRPSRWTAADREMHRRLAEGELLRLCPDVAVETSHWRRLPRWQQEEVRIQAVGESARRAALVGRSAARVHGIPVVGADTAVELNLPGRNSRPPRARWPEGVLYRSSRLREEDIVQVNGLRVTPIVRTATDIARYHGLVQGIVAFDAVLAMPGITKNQARQILEMLGPLRGRRIAHRALELADPLSESPIESWARAEILGAAPEGLEELRIQVRVLGGRFRVDLLLNERIVVELHGDVKYAGEEALEQMHRDRERERLLQNAGYFVLHAGYRELASGAFLGMVRDALAATGCSDGRRTPSPGASPSP